VEFLDEQENGSMEFRFNLVVCGEMDCFLADVLFLMLTGWNGQFLKYSRIAMPFGRLAGSWFGQMPSCTTRIPE
jgi:hypothetical protein